MIQFSALLLVAALALGANAGVTDKLVGAQMGYVGEFPYQVSLRTDGSHICGGALITTRHVVTAAHCVVALQGVAQNRMKVVVGTNSINSGGYGYEIYSLSHYPGYSDRDSWLNDIGVITLRYPVKLSNFVSLVRLPTKDVTVGDVAVVSGWGTMYQPNTPLSQNLLKLNLYIINREVCHRAMPNWTNINPSLVCTFIKNGAGTCSGDSGGPLVSNGQLIGVVSGGIPCAIGYPDVFTNVYHYLDYIRQVIAMTPY